WLRASVLALGFLGPIVLLISFASRYGLGLDAPWYLAELVAVRYVPIPTFAIALAWLAVAAQLAALAARRYAPYPSSPERRLRPQTGAGANAGARRARGCGGGVRQAAHGRTAAEVRARPEEPGSRAPRTARSPQAPRPGSRAGRRPASSRGRRTRSACPV